MRESKIHGRGLFAIADIAKDEIVAVKGGHIVDGNTLRETITPMLGPVEIQIGDDLFIAPVTEEERELSMLYSNHSCDPNLGMRGEITFVAVRDIRAGEELTHDWAMTDDDDYSIECNCGSPDCRKISHGQRLATPRFAEALRRLFFSLSCTQNHAAGRLAVNDSVVLAQLYEHRTQPLLSTPKFLKRVARHWLAGFGVLALGLGGGIQSASH